jgi:hypothetical protein
VQTTGLPRRDGRGRGASPPPVELPYLSLDSRLDILHRRRRIAFFKQFATTPSLVAASLVLLAVVGGIASLR